MRSVAVRLEPAPGRPTQIHPVPEAEGEIGLLTRPTEHRFRAEREAADGGRDLSLGEQ
jgi:hypothetical protein